MIILKITTANSEEFAELNSTFRIVPDMQGKYENAEKIIVSDNAEIPVYKGILYEFMSNNIVIKTLYEPVSCNLSRFMSQFYTISHIFFVSIL